MKTDIRNQQTEASIQKAFIKLVTEMGFNNIRITDITREAQIGRGTFYIHYVDKYDLLNKIERNLLQNIKQRMATDITKTHNTGEHSSKQLVEILNSPYRYILQSLDYVYAQRESIRALTSSKGDPLFLDAIKELVDKELFAVSSISTKELPEDYAHEIVLQSLLNIIYYWLQKKDPETPAEVSRIILKSRLLAPYQLLISK
ncbi:Transcriptional regulator, TetR family [Pediococcus damnosus]|uniref:Transcriptional regulator, TetR family n=1 Tax=Pediococcus damnosus TaxID=51663 RepID=A0A0R2HI09_9LACO|nr:TetR/AcrR family transcriptional regulator C-terminal domain-containing protein [Pediococcus damnosus]AMV60634.1 Transcriptional regulator, TetR family [Pediococcus damnosus]AMV62908.1 Transcriptional regulator, TetR family [Pediococcus damnosus]AMV64949.1 Transcriptional regulator, TetR family [Pediococcus damnosus]AMV67208.1 Transcriptional regulator, TetR family [Pediococcus damnosus]AMV69754.1 Transcriptional regulator, TetR family [Pediococcus damnosus]